MDVNNVIVEGEEKNKTYFVSPSKAFVSMCLIWLAYRDNRVTCE